MSRDAASTLRGKLELLSDGFDDHILSSDTDPVSLLRNMVTPAVVTRAASVVRRIRNDLGAAGTASAMTLLINNTLEAQGHHAIVRHDPNRLPEIYDPASIQADADLAQLYAGLVQSKSGRLCLYGPPATGKTAYGRWLAG